jgi:hypothetical protein
MDRTTKDFIIYASIVIGVICLLFWIYPQYKVYKERKMGEAELQRANYSRQIQIVESHAKLESATNLAAADTIRARGIAASKKNQIIYIPAGNLGFPLPIQEATRLQKPVVLPPPPTE